MSSVSADWYYRTIHVHTGYSTIVGYDNDILITGDNCYAEWLRTGFIKKNGVVGK